MSTLYRINITKWSAYQPQLKDGQARRFVWVTREIMSDRAIRHLDDTNFRLFMTLLTTCDEGVWTGSKSDIMDDMGVKSNRFDFQSRLAEIKKEGLIDFQVDSNSVLNESQLSSNSVLSDFQVVSKSFLNDLDMPETRMAVLDTILGNGIGSGSTPIVPTGDAAGPMEIVDLPATDDEPTPPVQPAPEKRSAPSARPRRQESTQQERDILAAFRRVKYPGQPEFSATQIADGLPEIRRALADGRTPEQVEQATTRALADWSKREMVTIRSVLRHIEDLLQPRDNTPRASPQPQQSAAMAQLQAGMEIMRQMDEQRRMAG